MSQTVATVVKKTKPNPSLNQTVNNAVVSAIKDLNKQGIDNLNQVETAPVGVDTRPVAIPMANWLKQLSGATLNTEVGQMPLSVADGDFYLTRTTIRKMQGKLFGKQDQDHNFTIDTIANIQDLLYHPVMVFGSKKRHQGVVLLTKPIDGQAHKTVALPITTATNGLDYCNKNTFLQNNFVKQRKPFNHISSMHARRDFIYQLAHLLYFDPKQFHPFINEVKKALTKTPALADKMVKTPVNDTLVDKPLGHLIDEYFKLHPLKPKPSLKRNPNPKPKSPSLPSYTSQGRALFVVNQERLADFNEQMRYTQAVTTAPKVLLALADTLGIDKDKSVYMSIKHKDCGGLPADDLLKALYNPLVISQDNNNTILSFKHNNQFYHANLSLNDDVINDGNKQSAVSVFKLTGVSQSPNPNAKIIYAQKAMGASVPDEVALMTAFDQSDYSKQYNRYCGLNLTHYEAGVNALQIQALHCGLYLNSPYMPSDKGFFDVPDEALAGKHYLPKCVLAMYHQHYIGFEPTTPLAIDGLGDGDLEKLHNPLAVVKFAYNNNQMGKNAKQLALVLDDSRACMIDLTNPNDYQGKMIAIDEQFMNRHRYQVVYERDGQASKVNGVLKPHDLPYRYDYLYSNDNGLFQELTALAQQNDLINAQKIYGDSETFNRVKPIKTLTPIDFNIFVKSPYSRAIYANHPDKDLLKLAMSDEDKHFLSHQNDWFCHQWQLNHNMITSADKLAQATTGLWQLALVDKQSFDTSPLADRFLGVPELYQNLMNKCQADNDFKRLSLAVLNKNNHPLAKEIISHLDSSINSNHKVASEAIVSTPANTKLKENTVAFTR